MSDRRLILIAAFLRALAVGMVGVLLGVFLAQKGLGPARAGAVVTAGLAGGAAATLGVTLAGDRWGRRRALLVLALLGGAGTFALSQAGGFAAAAIAAFVGMVNGMGRDRGAAMVLEQAILPSRVLPSGRTRAFAGYNVAQDTGHALGGLFAGLPALLVSRGIAEGRAMEGALVLNAVLLAASALLYRRLSPEVEASTPSLPLRVSPQARRMLVKISALFAVDAVAGGFLTAALLAYFFVERFGVGLAEVGVLFFAARVANAASHFAAAWIASRIGLVNTMVFTHVPSSLLLLVVPFAPSFPVAAALFLLREGLVEMDVPTRQSYVMAVVRPEERTVASGVTNLVRLGGWAAAPAFAGFLMSAGALGAPLMVGAGMKLAYDAALYFAFRRIPPPEETPPGAPGNPGSPD